MTSRLKKSDEENVSDEEVKREKDRNGIFEKVAEKTGHSHP